MILLVGTEIWIDVGHPLHSFGFSLFSLSFFPPLTSVKEV